MISHEEAIEFLKENQPLPSDDELEKDIKKFSEVNEYFIKNPDSICIPLFLNCFGEGSGFGVYQTIESLIAVYDDGLVICHLKNALFSKFPSVRYWCAQICESYEYDELIDGLINAYQKGNVDSKCAALTALSNYDDERVFMLVKHTLQNEIDEDLLEIANDIMRIDRVRD